MVQKGILVVVSGFAGAGKGTIMKQLVSEYDNYALSVSATSRNPRPGEVDGVNYFFKSREEFEEMIKNDELIEHAEYVGNYYGTPKAFVEKQLQEGKNVILEIEVQGAMNIKAQYPNAILIFITTKDVDTLYERLKGRGSETDDVIKKRMTRAAEEAESMEAYEFIVVNDDIEECVDAVNSIVVSEACRKENNTEFMIGIKKQLDDYQK